MSISGRSLRDGAGAEDKERHRQHSSDVEKFVALIVAVSTARNRGRASCLTVRADFYNPLIRNPMISGLLPRQQVNIPPMRREDLCSAIETPAKKVGLSSPRLGWSIEFCTTSDLRRAGSRCSSLRSRRYGKGGKRASLPPKPTPRSAASRAQSKKRLSTPTKS